MAVEGDVAGREVGSDLAVGRCDVMIRVYNSTYVLDNGRNEQKDVILNVRPAKTKGEWRREEFRI